MPRKRNCHSAELKARVALEAVKGVKAVQQPGKDFQVHPTQITIWKKQLTGQVAERFKREARGVLSADDEELRQAYEKIGRLDVELDWLKRNLGLSTEHKRQMIEREHPTMSIQRQCTLMKLSRSAYYYHAVDESKEHLRLMRLLDEPYRQTPFYGSRQMTEWFQGPGYLINRKRVQRLMRQMGLEGIAPRPHTSQAHPDHRRYPY